MSRAAAEARFGDIDACVRASPNHDDNTKVCSNCPFRKDKPFWLAACCFFLNLARINGGKAQHCHKHFALDGVTALVPEPVVCGGANRLKAGGDKLVFSEEEFRAQEPVSIQEAGRRFVANDEREEHGGGQDHDDARQPQAGCSRGGVGNDAAHSTA